MVNEYLPCYYDVDELSPPTAQQVAIRSVILSYVVGVTVDVPTDKLYAALVDLGVDQYLFQSEKNLFHTRQPTPQQITDAEWTFEHLLSLAWSMGRENIDPFVTDYAEASTENADLFNFFPRPFTDPSSFIENAKLREFADLYEAADLHYRLHWATVENRLRPHGCQLHENTIRHRRLALDWIIGVSSSWDDIDLDT